MGHKKHLGKDYAIKVHKLNKESVNLLDQSFAGKEIDSEKIKNIKLRNEKLKRINDKLQIKLDTVLTKKYGKRFSSDTYKKRLKSKIYNAIPQNVRSEIQKNGLSMEPIQKMIGTNAIIKSNNSSNISKKMKDLAEQDTEVKQAVRIAKRNAKFKVKSMRESFVNSYKEDQAKVDNMMKKTYKTNDISATNSDLFKIISNRYLSSIDRLDQNTINKAVTFDNLKLFEFVDHAARRISSGK